MSSDLAPQYFSLGHGLTRNLPPRLLPRLLRKQGRPQARQEPDASQAGTTE